MINSKRNHVKGGTVSVVENNLKALRLRPIFSEFLMRG